MPPSSIFLAFRNVIYIVFYCQDSGRVGIMSNRISFVFRLSFMQPNSTCNLKFVLFGHMVVKHVKVV